MRDLDWIFPSLARQWAPLRLQWRSMAFLLMILLALLLALWLTFLLILLTSSPALLLTISLRLDVVVAEVELVTHLSIDYQSHLSRIWLVEVGVPPIFEVVT